MSWLSRAIRALRKLLEVLLRGLLGKEKQTECVPCPPAVRKPDPFLYSQPYLISLGLPVTWDNPDIYIFQGNTPVDPHNLQASTDYTLIARIWNGSPDVPVLDMPVYFSYLSFGMGVKSNPIDTARVHFLNAKGLPGCPAFAEVTWKTPATLGHYCLQVLVEPPDDSNWLNNLGQRNTDVARAASPAAFQFEVGNHTGRRPRRVRFKVDSYAIPPLPPCDKPAGSQGRRIEASAPAVPPGWTVQLTPSELVLDPGEERQVDAAITPAPGFSGTMPFNVTAWDDIGAFGGVTLVVQVP